MANEAQSSPNKNTTALVLSGGGSKGAFQAGVLEVVREAGFTFDAISGVSVGSLNGAMLATDQFEQLTEIWNSITPDKVLVKNSLVGLARRFIAYKIGLSEPPVSRFNNAPLRKLMERYLLDKSITTRFHFGYVKLESGKYIQATIRQGGGHTIDQADLDRLLASTAIPVYFNPVRIGDSTAVDGGLRNISPIKDVLYYNPDRMVIIPTRPVAQEPAGSELRDILEIAFRSINIMLDEIFHGDIDRFLTVNGLAKQAEAQGMILTKSNGTPYRYIEPIIIDPKEPLGDGLDFGNDKVRMMIDLGRERAREVLEGLQDSGEADLANLN